MSTTKPPGKPLRADAQRNRDKLLAAAAAQFASAGPDSSLEAIAKAAGVGVGTLYRHFPTKDALLAAVYRQEVEQLHAAAAELLRANPPDEALALWLDRFVLYAATKRGMGAALRALVNSGEGIGIDVRGLLLDAIGTLLKAGVAAGSLRSDVDAWDVLRATGSVWQMPDEADWQEQARRLLRLLMDGLRHTGGASQT
ncbi:TetR/AcrR family transcriptional regulator [Conexibacter sp. JD483]|uniref:TetR/AcrR family transcriptional regulator n=1 Tax=unclassified Conexibacter TaxID=2627773 RepID=UPI00271DC1E8|nr:MULTISPECIES: TetR/AcrR family transcriptional regulator [unclassified Conexibacter]MDO8189011.1 TetR/AcrR family transcriptional regulator [Conexibacter sp. CPCC 205706]MDO8201411.1 TetR/AcrR family transcriptional regulator [Conexibacter sp. CPCC 205762]MDR9371702.1 TetR/AcrR family transcriptional regulator [Conexibacter sp. JD483]